MARICRYGGLGADTFEFGGIVGKDTIYDVTLRGAGHDVLAFDGALFADAKAVLSKAAQVGSNVVIAIDAENAITLRNASLLTLAERSSDVISIL